MKSNKEMMMHSFFISDKNGHFLAIYQKPRFFAPLFLKKAERNKKLMWVYAFCEAKMLRRIILLLFVTRMLALALLLALINNQPPALQSIVVIRGRYIVAYAIAVQSRLHESLPEYSCK